MSMRDWTRRAVRSATAVGVLLFAAASLASCDVADTDRVAGVDLEAATILTEHTDTGTATLEDGEFRAPVAPGSASELVIRLSQWRIGDLDGDGLADAAAITIEDPGGSGRFRYLHALLNEEGELHDADTVFLGDRIRVAGLSIHESIITVGVIERPPDAHFHELDDVQSMTRASIVVPKVSATRVNAVTEPGLRPCSISER